MKPGSKAPSWAFARGWQDWGGWGASWERKLWRCRGCWKIFEGRRPGMGAPGAGRRPLKLGWAGDERGTLPHPLKQDVLEGTRAPAWPVCVSPSLSDLWQLPPPTLPHRLRLNSTKRRNSPFTQGIGNDGSAILFSASSLPVAYH